MTEQSLVDEFDTICEARTATDYTKTGPDKIIYLAITIRGGFLGFGATEEIARTRAVSRKKIAIKRERRS